jgi:hypothetical protein
MPYFEYTWLASTHRPPDLGQTEFKILDCFANRNSQSAYGIFGELGKTIAYKDVHKRVKRLMQLKLIEQINDHFERGAKHYQITPYGLITKLSGSIDMNHKFILVNKKNEVIRSLLLQFFEEQTIDSFYFLKEFPTEDIGYYLHDCGSITKDICKEFWTEFDGYDITDILPSEDVIQKYMAYLDKKLVDQNVLDEIKKYEERLQKRLQDKGTGNKYERFNLANAVSSYDQDHFHRSNRYYEMFSHNPFIKDFREERPPFPLLEIYYNIVVKLSFALEEKMESLAFSLVSYTGKIIDREKIQSKQQLEEDILECNRDYSLKYMLKDKKIIEQIREIKRNFDIGYQQFMYYHRMTL